MEAGPEKAGAMGLGRRGQRRGRFVVPVLWAAIAAVLGTDVYLLTARTKTTTVTLDAAVEQFRAEAGSAGAAPPSAPPAAPTAAPPEPTPEGTTPTDPSGAPAAAGPAPTPSGTAHAAPPAAAAGSARTAGAAPDAASPTPAELPAATAPVPFTRPAEGVYAYRTTGGETASVAGARHDYPPRTYSTILHADGCRWTTRSDVVKEHQDRRTMCSEAGRVLQLSQAREVEFFGQRDGAELHCEPGLLAAVGEAPGTVDESRCTDGAGNDARMERTFVGPERLTVGGTEVEALRIVLVGSFTGKAEGTSRDELWLAADTGLTLRWDRSVDTIADAFGGAKVRYREQASFVLESLTPSR